MWSSLSGYGTHGMCLPPLLVTLKQHDSHLTPLLRIEDSVESFTEAVLEVVHERNLSVFWPFPCTGFPNLHGGILDHQGPETEKLRAVHAADYGSHPAGVIPGLRQDMLRPAVSRAGRLEASS